jgi:hypothetical protein
MTLERADLAGPHGAVAEVELVDAVDITHCLQGVSLRVEGRGSRVEG